MQPSPIGKTARSPSMRRAGAAALIRSCTVACQAELELVQRAIARQDLLHARIRLAAFADRREELAILQLDAVHRDIDLRDVDRLIAPGNEVVVARNVGPVVAGVTEERAGRPGVVERNRRGGASRGAG